MTHARERDQEPHLDGDQGKDDDDAESDRPLHVPLEHSLQGKLGLGLSSSRRVPDVPLPARDER